MRTRLTTKAAVGAVIAVLAIVATAGTASAHVFGTSSAARCLDAGGWEATGTISLDTNPGNPPPLTGTVAVTFPTGSAAVPFTVGAGSSATFGAGVVVPVDVTTVTFTFVGTFGDQVPFAGVVEVTQPASCTPPTTTTVPATTTTTVPATTTTVPAATTTVAGPTTTVAADLAITAITPICVGDAPFVRVTFGDQPQFDGRTATVTFIDLRGAVVAVHTVPYAANSTVTFVYPGASVDAAGNPTDWPGWVFDGDEWVPDPTDNYLRDGLTVRVEVNPTATANVTYPPATSSCANPPSGTTPGLPSTGADTAVLVWIAIGAVVAGGMLVLRSRRPIS